MIFGHYLRGLRLGFYPDPFLQCFVRVADLPKNRWFVELIPFGTIPDTKEPKEYRQLNDDVIRRAFSESPALKPLRRIKTVIRLTLDDDGRKEIPA